MSKKWEREREWRDRGRGEIEGVEREWVGDRRVRERDRERETDREI